jgi:2-keto-4-pentenoate hydratase/2-oxohepta-3-ene-1,7-dioic acid hydratase in catechol pathway
VISRADHDPIVSRSDLIFTVPKIVSFLSQGTTLNPGTIILTGTPAGVGWSSEPKNLLKDGDEFRVFVSHGVGTLINKIEEEK